MRSSTFNTATLRSSDDRLTTGEAAKLLNCSRQHVVDLCEQGLLPYTTVGTHRRVSRSDVEAVRARTDRLNREERRSLWLAYAVAGRVAADPDPAVRSAREQIERMRPHARGQARRWLDEWAHLLDGPVPDLLAALTDRTLRGRELRQNSPFAGLIEPAERNRILTAWRDHDQGPHR
jgi:excisionase family DNA binding protein